MFCHIAVLILTAFHFDTSPGKSQAGRRLRDLSVAGAALWLARRAPER
jgi:hypothetical protein